MILPLQLTLNSPQFYPPGIFSHAAPPPLTTTMQTSSTMTPRGDRPEPCPPRRGTQGRDSQRSRKRDSGEDPQASTAPQEQNGGTSSPSTRSTPASAPNMQRESAHAKPAQQRPDIRVSSRRQAPTPGGRARWLPYSEALNKDHAATTPTTADHSIPSSSAALVTGILGPACTSTLGSQGAGPRARTPNNNANLARLPSQTLRAAFKGRIDRVPAKGGRRPARARLRRNSRR